MVFHPFHYRTNLLGASGASHVADLSSLIQSIETDTPFSHPIETGAATSHSHGTGTSVTQSNETINILNISAKLDSVLNNQSVILAKLDKS